MAGHVKSSYIEHGVLIPVIGSRGDLWGESCRFSPLDTPSALCPQLFDQRGELPLLPFGYPIGFVPASRGEVYIKSKKENNYGRDTTD